VALARGESIDAAKDKANRVIAAIQVTL